MVEAVPKILTVINTNIAKIYWYDFIGNWNTLMYITMGLIKHITTQQGTKHIKKQKMQKHSKMKKNKKTKNKKMK